MPWTLQSRPDALRPDRLCAVCEGTPPDTGRGTGRCGDCGAVLLCADPGLGEMFRLTFVPCRADGTPVPCARRQTMQIDWGERRQADGRMAKVFRLVDRQHGVYREKVTLGDEVIVDRDEPLADHHGHGAARREVGRSQRLGSRRWVALRFEAPGRD